VGEAVAPEIEIAGDILAEGVDVGVWDMEIDDTSPTISLDSPMNTIVTSETHNAIKEILKARKEKNDLPNINNHPLLCIITPELVY